MEWTIFLRIRMITLIQIHRIHQIHSIHSHATRIPVVVPFIQSMLRSDIELLINHTNSSVGNADTSSSTKVVIMSIMEFITSLMWSDGIARSRLGRLRVLFLTSFQRNEKLNLELELDGCDVNNKFEGLEAKELPEDELSIFVPSVVLSSTSTDLMIHQLILCTLDYWESVDFVDRNVATYILEMWFEWHSSLWPYRPKEDIIRIDGCEVPLPDMIFLSIKTATINQIMQGAFNIKDYSADSSKLRVAPGNIWQDFSSRREFLSRFFSAAQSVFQQQCDIEHQRLTVELSWTQEFSLPHFSKGFYPSQKALRKISNRAMIAVKRIGELDSKPFLVASKSKYAKKVEEKSTEFCSLWEDHLRNPGWYPFKIIKVGDNHQQGTRQTLSSLFASSSNNQWISSINMFIDPVLNELYPQHSSFDFLYNLGRAWVLIGAGGLPFHLCLPVDDVDPALKYAFNDSQLMKKVSLLELERKDNNDVLLRSPGTSVFTAAEFYSDEKQKQGVGASVKSLDRMLVQV